MLFLIVEENVGAESLQYGCLIANTDEMGFVGRGAPRTQRADDAFVSGRVPRGHQCYPDFADVVGIQVNSAKRGELVEEIAKRSARQRISSIGSLVFQESLEPLILVDCMRLLARIRPRRRQTQSELRPTEYPRVPSPRQRDALLPLRPPSLPSRRVGVRKEKVDIPGRYIRGQRSSASKTSSLDGQSVVIN